MPVREFSDAGGRRFRVWDVRPDSVDAPTKQEVYLARLFHTGWLVFESFDEEEKRRLAPIPPGWSSLPDAQLEMLRRRADLIPPRKLRRQREAHGADAAREQARAVERVQQIADLPPAARSYLPADERPDITDLGVIRSFRYPGGRLWVVGVCHDPTGVGAPVLRFTCGARHIDLRHWPKDWADARPEQLALLLRQAAPRALAQSPPPLGTPRRRWDDAHP